ncbi:hypothetical protein EI94DRAFT_1808887 [Lactarius quietus]|nr:hypothetical protein EI94DRAFT_1808887 [Lactarius quietus]
MLFTTTNPETTTEDSTPVTEAKQFSLAKLIRFDLKEHQLGVLTLKKQANPGKAPQETPRITEVHTDDSDSEDGPSQFTHKFPPRIPQPIHRDLPSMVAEHPYAAAEGQVDQEDKLVLPLPPPQKSKHAYTTNSNIYNGAVARKVYKHLLDTEVTVTHRELLSLALELCTKVTDVTVQQRLMRTNAQVVIEDFVPPKPGHTAEAHMLAAFSKAMRAPPADATIIADPYEAFLQAWHSCQDHEDDPIEVAAESSHSEQFSQS